MDEKHFYEFVDFVNRFVLPSKIMRYGVELEVCFYIR